MGKFYNCIYGQYIITLTNNPCCTKSWSFAIAKMKKVEALVSGNEGYIIRCIIIFELSYHEFNWKFHGPYLRTIFYWFPCVLNCIWSTGSILSLTMTPLQFSVTHKMTCQFWWHHAFRCECMEISRNSIDDSLFWCHQMWINLKGLIFGSLVLEWLFLLFEM